MAQAEMEGVKEEMAHNEAIHNLAIREESKGKWFSGMARHFPELTRGIFGDASAESQKAVEDRFKEDALKKEAEKAGGGAAGELTNNIKMQEEAMKKSIATF